MLQACFDDSGKTEPPVFVLAGFVARPRRWEAYSRDWARALNLSPSVAFLSTNEAFQRTGCFAGWSRDQVENRLLRLVRIIRDRVEGGVIFTLDHAGYRAVMAKVRDLPLTRDERRKVEMLKNPFYLGFHTVVLTMLAEHQAAHSQERLEILFDRGIDREERLKNGYRDLIRGIGKDYPEHVKLLTNHEAEFRDDKVFLPLQAADLLAWNVRRDRYERARGRKHRWGVWKALENAVPYRRYHYSKKDVAGMMGSAANIPAESLM